LDERKGRSGKDGLWQVVGIDEDPLWRWVVVFFSLLIALNIATFAIGPSNLSVLKVSRSQWWGAITSIGLFDAWGSGAALALSPPLWFLLNTRLPSGERRGRSQFFIMGSIATAISANFFWIVSKHGQFEFSYGVSGVDVAADGIILVFALVNLISSLTRKSGFVMVQPRANDKKGFEKFVRFIYFVLAIAMIAVPVSLIETAASNVNTEDHVLSLAFSVGGTTIFESLRFLVRHRESTLFTPPARRYEPSANL